MPDSVFANIPDGYTIYSLSVDEESTAYNSIRAGDYIDLYMSYEDDSGDEPVVVYGRLIESIRVLAVRDSKGNNIVQNGTDYGDPSELLFAVEEEDFLLLMDAGYINDSVDLEPVIRNSEYSKNKDINSTKVSSNTLKNYIMDQVYSLE